MRPHVTVLVLLIVISVLPSCSQPGSQPGTSQPSAAPQASQAAPPANPGTTAHAKPETAANPAATPVKATTIPAGTVLTVRMGQAVGSKISSPGESFTATLAQPLEVNGAVVAPAGTPVKGTVAEAVPLGRFKGGAKLRLTLDAIEIGGKSYRLQTSTVARSAKGKGKRTATMIGGGAGVGALIGGLAGGGKGAAIGAVAGAGAGTAGSAFTGNKDIVIGAERVLSFKLNEPVEVR